MPALQKFRFSRETGINQPDVAIRVGLAGRGIQASRTPRMHEDEARAQGLLLTYDLFDFTANGWDDCDLPRLLDAAHSAGYAGLNITYPHKQSVLGLLDTLAPCAEAIGAVNTVRFAEDRRIGCNTDVTGFASGFQAGLPDVAMATVLQLGCGGAGAAVANALLGQLGAGQLLLYDIDLERSAALQGQLAETFGQGRCGVVADPNVSATRADGVVNASPIGTEKFPGSPLAGQAIESKLWVADVIYFPLETELLAVARARGCATLDGSGMAIGQAVDAFAIFTGQVADRARMRRSFDSFIVNDARTPD
jgi:shikimate dehydrogenase